MLYRVHLVWAGFELTTLVVIGTDNTGICNSNYHTITTTTTASLQFEQFTIYLTHSYLEKMKQTNVYLPNTQDSLKIQKRADNLEKL